MAFLQPPEILVIEHCAAWILHEDEKRLRIRLNESAGLKQNAKSRLQSIVLFTQHELAHINALLSEVEIVEAVMREVRPATRAEGVHFGLLM